MFLKALRNERGMTTVEVFLTCAIVLWFVLGLIDGMEVFYIKPIVTRAARDAQRDLAINHDINRAKNIAITRMAEIANINWIAATDGKTHQVFDPDRPNSNKDNNPDVFLYDDGTDNCQVTVRYHIVNLAPGFAKLLNPNAPLMSKYIDLECLNDGPREYVPTS